MKIRYVFHLFFLITLSACFQSNKHSDGATANGAITGVTLPVQNNAITIPPGVTMGVISGVGTPTNGGTYLQTSNTLNIPQVTYESLAGLPSSTAKSIKVSNYFPRPAPGEVLLNEFSYTDGNGGWIPFQIQRYLKNPNSTQYFLEDYLINYPTPGFHWADTWVYTNDGGNVVETYDSAATYVANWNVAPLNHGNVIEKGVPFTNNAFGEITMNADPTPYSLWNNYYINLIDIKETMTLPGGTFKNVAMQVEQQMDNVNPEPSRYIFFFAPNTGIVAMQYLDNNWNKKNNMLVLTKSCKVTSNIYRCP